MALNYSYLHSDIGTLYISIISLINLTLNAVKFSRFFGIIIRTINFSKFLSMCVLVLSFSNWR